jgi:type I restriction-modification system DNA methylase subunit
MNFGIREDMFAIATTNMILRGDGKSNLINTDFLSCEAKDIRKHNYTVGFINPPYSQAKGKDTAHLSEIHFIKHLLDGLKEGGRCVVIVPQSTMVGKTKEDKKVKKQILESHTLEGVITLNKILFMELEQIRVLLFSQHINPILARSVVNL